MPQSVPQPARRPQARRKRTISPTLPKVEDIIRPSGRFEQLAKKALGAMGLMMAAASALDELAEGLAQETRIARNADLRHDGPSDSGQIALLAASAHLASHDLAVAILQGDAAYQMVREWLAILHDDEGARHE